MGSRVCSKCDRAFPPAVASTSCVWCDQALAYDTSRKPDVTKDDYDTQSYIRGRRIPASLNEEELTKIEREWEALAVEMGRRRGLFTAADLIGEGFGSVREAA